MAIITSGNHSYVLTESVTAIAVNEYMSLPMTVPLLANFAPTSASDIEEHASIGGLGRFEKKTETGAADKDETTQQYKRQWTHEQYALEIELSRTFVDDQKWQMLSEYGMELGRAANRSVEEDGAKPFTDAFDGNSVLCEDGLSLCNDAHVNVDGGNSQDNSGTNTLGVAGLKTTDIAMRKTTDYRGKRIKITPDLLLVPLDLQEEALQLTMALQKPGSANNDVNTFRGTGLIVWEELTDTNAWFRIDSALMRQHNYFFMRTGLEYYGSRNQSTQVISMGGWMRYSYGPKDWRWIYGNNPS